MAKDESKATLSAAADGRSRPGMLRRLCGMALLWLGLGATVGAVGPWPGEGLIGLAASLIAWMIVLTPLGATLGLLGGRVKETFLGMSGGAAAGTVVPLVVPLPDPSPLLTLGAVYGGLVGATLPGLLRLGRRIVAGARSALAKP